MEEKALIEVEKLDVVKLFSEDGMTEILDKIKAKTDEFVPDLETDSGRKEIASMAHKVARSKTLIDGLGKETQSEWKKKVDAVNALRKKARDFLDDLKGEVRKPLTEWDEEQERIKEEKIQKELERVEKLNAKIADIEKLASIPNDFSCGYLNVRIEKLDAYNITEEEFEDRYDEAVRIKNETLDILTKAYKDREKWEKEQAEAKVEAERLEKIRKEQAEAQAKIDEANRKIQEERDRLEKERKEADEKRVAIRVTQLKGVIYNGQEAIDGTGATIISKADLISLQEHEFEQLAKSHNKIVEDLEKEAEERRKAEAEREAKEKLEREERDRKEREEAEAAERERQEALKPDKEKLMAFADKIFALAENNMKLESEGAKAVFSKAIKEIMAVSENLKARLEEL